MPNIKNKRNCKLVLTSSTGPHQRHKLRTGLNEQCLYDPLKGNCTNTPTIILIFVKNRKSGWSDATSCNIEVRQVWPSVTDIWFISTTVARHFLGHMAHLSYTHFLAKDYHSCGHRMCGMPHFAADFVAMCGCLPNGPLDSSWGIYSELASEEIM